MAATTNGYITKSKFHEYAIQFVLSLKRNGLLDRTHLLIIDSHKSHVYNYPFLQYMLSNNIQVMAIPAHCSHIVQPLDNVPFACFKRSWEKHLDNWNFQHLGALLNKANFFTVFNRAFYSSMSESNIKAGFKNTGIYPVNYEAIPTSKMAPSYVTDVLRNDNSKKMLNALHLKILYLRIIVRFLNFVTILCLILYPNCIIELDLFTFHLQSDLIFIFISKLHYLILYSGRSKINSLFWTIHTCVSPNSTGFSCTRAATTNDAKPCHLRKCFKFIFSRY